MKRKHIRVRKKRNLNEILLGRGIFNKGPIPGSLPYALERTPTLADLGPKRSKKRKR